MPFDLSNIEISTPSFLPFGRYSQSSQIREYSPLDTIDLGSVRVMVEVIGTHHKPRVTGHLGFVDRDLDIEAG